MSSISFFSQFENTERILLNKAEEVDETRQKLATGKKVQEPSDDPAAVVDINRFSNQLDNIEQIQKNIDNGKTTLENSEGAMSKLSDLLQRVRQLSVKAANETLDEDARKSIATEVNQRLEEAVTVANTQIGGNYLFSGTETASEQAPFEVKRTGEGEIIEVNYRGDANARENKISQGKTIETNITGNRLFQATNQGIVGDFEFEFGAELQKNLSRTVGYNQIENPPAETTTANAGPDATTTLQVSDASQFSVGEEVKVYDSSDASGENDYEETVITNVNTATNEVDVDLRHTHEAADNPVIESKSSDVQQSIGNGGTFGNDASTAVAVSNAGTFQVGDKIKISGGGNTETRVVQAVNTGPNTIEVDLANNYAGGATVERVAERTTPNGEGQFEINGEKFFYNTRKDSIVDVAKKINERGIQVKASFVEKTEPQPEVSQRLTANAAAGNNVTLNVADASNFRAGQKVTVKDNSSGEKALIQSVDSGANTITVDSLGNSYTTANDTTVETVQTEEPREFSPEEVVNADQRQAYKFKLESRVPHQMAVKDFDRQPDTTPNRVEGLMNDLQLLGDGEGNPPEPSADQNHPTSYHKDAKIKGKSIFDTMVDLREALQQSDDPDGDTDSVTAEHNLPKGNAQRDAYFDPDRLETINESIGDLQSAIENVNVNRSIGGARINRLETADSRSQDFEVNTKTILSQVRDADLAKVITDLRRQQAVQEAALKMAAQTNQLSLANFL